MELIIPLKSWIKEILENREKNLKKQQIQELAVRKQMREINKISETTKQRIKYKKCLE